MQRILFNTANRANLVTIRIYDWLEREMSKIADCKYWGPRRKDYEEKPLQEVIKHLYGDDGPDWVIATPFMHSEHGRWIGYSCPKKRKWKIAAFTDDLHANWMLRVGAEEYCEALNQANFDLILMWYAKLGYAKSYHPIDPEYFLKNLTAKAVHIPKFVDPEAMKPLDNPKIYDVAFLGAMDRRQYPLRLSIHQRLPILAERHGWRVLIRGRPPGSEPERFIGALEQEGYVVGDKYSEALANSKVLIFGCSIYKYPLLKYFEGWATRTLVMADRPFHAERLGLEDGVNYVEVNDWNWVEKLKYYLEHDEEREKIAQAGYDTFLAKHTSSIRAKELLKVLEENI